MIPILRDFHFRALGCQQMYRNPKEVMSSTELMQVLTKVALVFCCGPRPSTPLEEFENRGIILKTHQMFSVHATPDEFKNKTITGHFGFVCLKLGMGNPMIL